MLDTSTVEALSALDEMWAKLDAAKAKRATGPRPPNSFSIDDYAHKYSLNRDAARCRLNRLVRDGVLEKHQVRSLDSAGRPATIPVYTVIE